MVSIKNSHEIEAMKKSAALLKQTFSFLEEHIREGVSTKYLNDIVYDFMTSHHAVPSFLNYNGYPASICASVDDVVVHGIPSERQILKDGQIVGIDMGLILEEYHSDCARTYLIGNVSQEKRKLVEVTRESFFEGLEGIKEGSRLGDISYQIQSYAESFGYGVVTQLTGHGIGRSMHEDPSVPNYGKAGHGLRLAAGMTLAIEPMINMGTAAVDFMPDGWTTRTKDRKPSAHYENTVLITRDGVEILTL